MFEQTLFNIIGKWLLAAIWLQWWTNSLATCKCNIMYFNIVNNYIKTNSMIMWHSGKCNLPTMSLKQVSHFTYSKAQYDLTRGVNNKSKRQQHVAFNIWMCFILQSTILQSVRARFIKQHQDALEFCLFSHRYTCMHTRQGKLKGLP